MVRATRPILSVAKLPEVSAISIKPCARWCGTASPSGRARRSLVVCNPATQNMGELLRNEAADVGAEAVLAVMSERASHAAEPPADGGRGDGRRRRPARARPSSRSRTPRRASAPARTAPAAATLPGVTEDMLARVMSADMEGLRRKGHAVADALDRARRGPHHRRERHRSSARPLRARGHPRRRRADRARRLREPALRRGLHLAEGRQRHAGDRRIDGRRRARRSSRSSWWSRAGT